MRLRTRTGRPSASGIAAAVALGTLALPAAALAQDPTPYSAPANCTFEAEPNEMPEQASSLVGELCLTGTLPAQIPADQDLMLWEVLPEDGLTTWAFTMRGVPTTITSIHVIPITSAPGVLPLETGSTVLRVDSDALLDTPPGVAASRVAPGRYLLGISRGLPFEQDLTDDIGYEVSIVRTGELPASGDTEPNNDPTAATPLSGPFALSGDLQATNDFYRWTVTPEDVVGPLRLEAQTAIGAPLTLELFDATGQAISSVIAAADGVATLHDLGLAPGDYDVRVTAGAAQAQPYTLAAASVTDAGVDPEPNDAPERALPLDSASLAAGGRLTADTDIDQHVLELDAGLAANLIDIDLSWSEGLDRTLCLSTEAGSRINCLQGDGHVALPGLLLAEGRYRLEVSGQGSLDDRYALRVAPGAALPPSGDIEPNDDAVTASSVAGAFALAGDLAGGIPGTGDVFAWALSEAEAARFWRIEASGTPGILTRLELRGPDGTSLASAQSAPDGTARIFDLRLSAGTYAVWLTKVGSESPRYVLRSFEETAPDVDPEPNDGTTQALPLDPATRAARGRIATGTDVDVYAFDVDAMMAETSTEVSLTWPGDVPYRLCVTKEGTPLQCRDARDGIVLTDLALEPDRYTLVVSGFPDLDARYQLQVGLGQPPSVDHEVEPNDLDITATVWDEALVMHGGSTDGDLDTYRVTIEGEPELWRLDVAGSGLSTPSWRQPDGTRVGVGTVSDDGTTAAIEDLYLVQGEHLLAVGAGGEYSLTLTPLGPVDTAAEREPNDDPDHAGLIDVGGTRTGRLATPEDVDVYRFSLQGFEHITLTTEPPADGSASLEVAADGTTLALISAAEPGEPTVFDGLLPPADYEVWLRPTIVGSGTYTLGLGRADPFVTAAEPTTTLDDVQLNLDAATTEVAAFWPDEQVVEATLTISNDGPSDVSLDLDWAASHDAWAVDLGEAAIEVSAGDATTLPLVINVAPDAWNDIPVRVTTRARTPDGAQQTAFIEVTPGQDIDPVAPAQAWSVPAEMLGGLDVASLALGGQAVPDAYYDATLHDGLDVDGSGSLVFFQNDPFTHAVDLAGDGPVPVAGIILNPLGADPQYGFRPRAFQLLLSDDGVTYAPALTGEMSPLLIDQPFALEEPVPARFAQLRIDSTWGGTEGGIALGEWKVVAQPGFVGSAEPIDIAAWSNGGHVVWTEPQAPQQYYHPEMLDEGFTAIRTFDMPEAQPIRLVIGFRDGRAAQITDLEWVDPTGANPASLVPSVEVEVSTAGPQGPWRSLGRWDLVRAADGSAAPFQLPEPAWARDVRLTIPASFEPPVTSWVTPATLRIHERPTDETYRSILGEWGYADPRGIYELLDPPRHIVSPADSADAPDTPEEAAPLAAGEAAAGQVRRNRDVDWYNLSVPDGDDTLTIQLRADRGSGARPVLVDDAGHPVDLERRPTEDRDLVTWTGIVEPGTQHRLRVEQPALSVVFAWDTSGSVQPFLPAIRAALGAFAADITPGEEAVQVLPFGHGLLLEGWSDQAYLIQGAMDAFTYSGGSSEVEGSVDEAATELAERDGMRAILLITDGITTSFPSTTKAWQDVARSGTMVFPVHFGGTDDPVISSRLLHDWADGTGGFYQYATSQAAIERAFDRMATWLRRPAAYGLSYATSFVGYPPGTLSVVPAEGASVPVGGGVSVELVLDTSGSMNKRLAGVTRMAVAREVLVRLVDETLPEGLPVALRTFKAGNGSCKTVLAVPFGPLERAAMDRVIAELPLHRKTRTPLGATLRAVGDDLAGRPGPKVVVFVTDGKETCKGDPAAEVERLVELGVEVALNIVGFALEDPALKADMESWAASGGGVFFDAQDQESLLGGIVEALRAPFRVYGRDGALVASGVVGGAPVGLPAGSYRVEVLSEPPAAFEAVEVAPGEAVRLEVGPGAP